MATEYLTDVRSELQSRSTRTTLEELKRKGLDQVRVIRSSQILELIEQAVDRALARRGEGAGTAERQELLQESAQIFRELFRSEMQQRGTEQQGRLEEMRAAFARQQQELADSRARQAELDAELRVLRQRAQGGAPQDLLDELRSLRKEIARPSPAAAGRESAGALEAKLQSLGAELSSQIERIGRKVGVRPTEETPADISGLFTTIPELESNLDAVEAKERKGSDVADALARMKSLRGGGRGGT